MNETAVKEIETMAYTNETAYTTYRQASQAVLDKKELVKALQEAGTNAAMLARRTPGTFDEKLAAVKAAWVPFTERIAQVEAEIAENYKIADENFDAWKGLNQ